MPQDSKRKRHLRRVKRERSLLYRHVDQLLAERELSRQIITGMGREIERLNVGWEREVRNAVENQGEIYVPEEATSGEAVNE